jgi:Leucine Rich repeat
VRQEGAAAVDVHEAAGGGGTGRVDPAVAKPPPRYQFGSLQRSLPLAPSTSSQSGSQALPTVQAAPALPHSEPTSSSSSSSSSLPAAQTRDTPAPASPASAISLPPPASPGAPPSWPSWTPPHPRPHMRDLTGRLHRLVPRLEDCAKGMALATRPGHAWALVPPVLCVDTGTVGGEFWDCEDLVRWVAVAWAGWLWHCVTRTVPKRPDVVRLLPAVHLDWKRTQHCRVFTRIPHPRSLRLDYVPDGASEVLGEALQRHVLAELETLRVVDCERAALQAVAAAAVRAGPLPLLRSFHYSGRCAGPVLEMLCKKDQFRGLRELRFYGYAESGHESMDMFGAALAQLPSLRQLSVNAFPPRGLLSLFAAIESVGALKELRTLVLGAVVKESRASLCEAINKPGSLPALQELRFRTPAFDVFPWLSCIRPGALPALRTLEFVWDVPYADIIPEDIPDDIPGSAARFPLLHTLVLNSVNCQSPHGMRWLGEAIASPGSLPSLRTLDLSRSVVDAESMAAFCAAITTHHVGHLPMTKLVLGDYFRFGSDLPACMRALSGVLASGALARLEVLDLGSSGTVDIEGTRPLCLALEAPAALPVLRELYVPWMTFDGEDMRCLCESLGKPSTIPTLQRLWIGNHGDSRQTVPGMRCLGASIAVPGAFPSLTALDLPRADLRDEGMQRLCEALGKANAMPMLRTLRFHNNSLQGPDFRWLGEAIGAPGALRSLRSLTLRGCYGGGDEAMRWLGAGLEVAGAVPSLETLDVTDCSIGSEGLRHLCRALGKADALPSLRTLKLAENKLEEEDLRWLGEAIGAPGALARLEELDLECTGLGTPGIRWLCSGILVPGALPSIRKINIARTCEPGEAVDVLTEAMSRADVVPTLQMLAMFDCVTNAYMESWGLWGIVQARPMLRLSERW